ncbi:CCR4-Not complex component, Not1-domain-containing protein [Gilbertella persicaria]|uniref:CCR4-Not complex component, Not1-domain-containing protein n=1 Tax=Gilbertella persicaria TaxID=101096 RepID=UPI00221F4CDD|nr:CCR4-Not complex component, Not1-domain-containing protein [Gilbertella persicaria]KAI8088056.1 CCR4-Not complex component, Not1-domain-containing protein [Gilbertella persicaria]
MLIELDRLLRQSGNLPFTLLPPHHDIILVMRQIPLLINQSAQPTLLKSIVEKIVHQLYLSKTSLSVEVYCRFLQSLLELSPSISKETLSWFLYSEDERKNDVWIMTSLIKYGLIPLEEYDIKLSHQLNQQPTDNGLIEFITELLQNCLLTMQPITSIEEHVLVIHALQKLDSPKAKELIQDLEKKSNEAHRHLDQTNAFLFRFLFAEWTRVCRLHPANPAFYRQFSERILKTITYDTDKQCFFFRLCTEACVELYRPARSQSMDAYSKLIGLMVQAQEGYSAKLKMISQVFSVVVLVLAHHYEYQHVQFNQKPFLKLLCSLFVELNHTTSKDRDVNASLVIVYSDTLYTLEPLQFPGFAFSWLQLFSHRLFLPLLLSSEEGPQQTGHTICFKLMSAHLSFLSQLVQQRQSRRLSQSEKSFYQGTLRFLVVMLHDYPEFLCQHYHGLIQLLPVDCIQLRNLMLSSFPRTMILPNPFTTPLGYMATHSSPPELYTDASYYSINTFDFNLDCLDDYLSGSTTQLMGSSILQHLTHQGTLDPVYTQQFVFYVGTQAKLDITRSLSENPAVQIYKYLLSQLTDSKDKYTVLNAIVDHLRYPNSHTYFFSMALMHLFSTQSDIVKELITRVLLERLIVNRPHPWGLLTTFIQLIKEPLFTEHAFIKESMHRSPDIKRLFDNVLKSTQPMP